MPGLFADAPPPLPGSARAPIRWKRVLIVAVGLGLLGLAFRFLPPEGSWIYPRCQLNKYTGLLCPGCGATRSMIHLGRGQWLEAWRSNLLVIPALLACLWVGGGALVPWLRGGKVSAIRPTQWQVLLILLMLVLYGVGRNAF